VNAWIIIVPAAMLMGVALFWFEKLSKQE